MTRRRKPAEAEDQSYSPLHVMVGWNVRAYRLQMICPVRRLARYAGVSDATLLRLERGEMDIRLQTLDKIAGALGVTPAALLSPLPPVRALTRGADGRQRREVKGQRQ